MKNTSKLTYYLTTRGFGSEIIQMVNAIAYSIITNREIIINSTKWNSKYEKGWFDYFNKLDYLQFNEKVNYSSYKISNINISQQFIIYAYSIDKFKRGKEYSPNNRVFKFLIPTIKYFYHSILNLIKNNKNIEIIGGIATNLNANAHKLWSNNIKLGNLEKEIDVIFNKEHYTSLVELRKFIIKDIFNSFNNSVMDFVN